MSTYLFIDGGSLQKTVQGFSEQLTGDKNALTIDLSGLGSGYQRVFYYDAMPGQDYGENPEDYRSRVAERAEFFDAIRSIPYFHVFTGEIKGKKPRQKRVDVALAVDMLTHTFRKNMTHAVLFASDDDFTPLVESLIREGMNTTVWYPPRSARSLLNAADIARPFDLKEARPWLLRGTKRAYDFINEGTQMEFALTEMPRRKNSEGRLFYVKETGPDATMVCHHSGGIVYDFVVVRAPGASEQEVLSMLELTRAWKLS